MSLLDWYRRAVRRARARRANRLLRHPAFDGEFQRAVRAFFSDDRFAIHRWAAERRIEDRLLEPTEREAQARRARRPRPKRRAAPLRVRALVPYCHLQAQELRNYIEAEGRLVHEPDNGDEEFRLTLDGDNIHVYSYATDEEGSIPPDQLREYLKRARLARNS